MKFGESPDLKKEKERAAALSSTMRDSLVSFQSVRRAFGDRISQQNSRWKELAPHSQEEEDAFVLRMQLVNTILQDLNDVGAKYHDEKQALNRLVLDNSKRKDERLIDPLKKLNDICELEIQEDFPKRVELNSQLEVALSALEEYVSEAST